LSLAVESTKNILFAYSILNANELPSWNSYVGKLIRYNPHGSVLNQLNVFYVNAMKLQANGKIVLAGSKNLILGTQNVKKQVVRLNTDLTVDTSFSFVDNNSYKNHLRGEIINLDLQSSGKIILSGDFTDFNGLIENNVARINADGSFDHSFNRRSGCDGSIFASATQSNGKTIIGGEFSSYDFHNVPNIARLKTNGRWDNTFHPGTGTNGKIYSIALTANHKYIIGGDFTSYDGHPCHNIVRLYGDGSIDLGFTAQTDDIVRKITIADGGKIIIGGNFNQVNGVARIGIARLHPNGALDVGFTSPITDTLAEVTDCKITPVGKIYTSVNYRSADPLFESGYVHSKILRLSDVGIIDTTFTGPVDIFHDDIFYQIQTIAFNNAGKLLAGGSSSSLEGGMIVQLNSNGSIDSAFDYTASLNYMEFALFPSRTYRETGVRTIDVLPNNTILIGGEFPYHIHLLNPNGIVNSHLFQYADDNIYTTTRASDDNTLVIAGIFNEYSYNIRNSIARINLSAPEMKSLEQNVAAQLAGNSISVYPNPAISEINVNNLKPGSTLRVYNSIGQEVYTKAVDTQLTTIDVSNFLSGIYYVISENNGERTNIKFIVQK
jgi:uncharacterized delta-60 repeat protein